MSTARSWTAFLFSGLLGAALAAGCTGGGGGSTPPAGTPAGGTSTGSTGQTQNPTTVGYVNPAWQDAVAAPSSLWPAGPGPAARSTSMADWFQTRTWLLDRSTWQSYIQNGNLPGRDALGAFGLGNGRCFGMVGLSYPLNTLHGMEGPRYSPGDYFGDVSVGMEVYPQTIAFNEEWLWKPRRAAATVTKSRGSQVELYTVDVAPPGVDAIIRVLIAKNVSQATLTSVNGVVRIIGDSTSTEANARLLQDRSGRRLTIGATGTQLGAQIGTSAGASILRVPFGTLAPGQESTAMLYLIMSDDEARRQAELVTIQSVGVDALLEATRQHWVNFFDAGAAFDFPDPKVADFVDDMTVCIATQIAENGCVSPMSRYTKTWMRDQEGCLRLFLREGRPEPVRRMLDTYYKTSILANGIYNSMAADVDVSQAGAAPDWMTGGFMDGRNPTEAPSYIPIELYDYYKATGDLAMLAQQYDYARAAVLRQEVDPSGLMKFNGDEPFRWVMMVATGLFEPENRGWSSNSAFLYVAAADRMAKIAGLLGKAADAADFQARASLVRTATETNYWLPGQGFYDVARLFYASVPVGKPFEDISLMPLRIGYADPKDPRMRQNLLSVKSLLETRDGFIQSQFLVPGVGVSAYDGMVPGYYLMNMTLVDHGEAERAFNALGRSPLCTGEVAEGQSGAHLGNSVILEYLPEGHGGNDIVARYRPWEGGLCAESALWYLFGEDWDAPNGKIAVTPHMPNGWGEFAARNLKCNGQLYDVEVRDFGGRRLERVTNRSGAPLLVDLGGTVVGRAIGQVRLDGQALAAQPTIDADLGRLSFRVQRLVNPGDWVDLDFDYTK